LTGTYITAAPVVHEGFIPAPGHEEEDALDDLYPSYRDSLFNDQSDDSNDSDDERELLAEEERLLRDIESKNDDADYDSDFSMEDAEEYDEDDPDELIVEEEIDDEEDDDDDVQTRRPRSSTRGGRGRGRGRGRPPSRGRGGLRGSQSKRGRGRPKAARGPRPTADPGPEFKEYQRVANDAYLRKDYPKALENANKAIRLNPEIFATHSLRSEIFADMGNEQMSLEALLVGAPTKRDKELWFYIIDRVKKIDPKEYPVFTNSNKTALILDCLRAILLIDGDDYEARSQKLEIESRLGHISRSVKMCRRMLSLRPYDIAVLKMMARLGTSSPKQTRLHLSSIINSFDTSIAYLLEHDDPANSNLDWSLLNIYLDLLDQNGDYARGITRAKTLSRWIQLRKDETYWEDQEDDREFDADDLPRRVAVPDFTGSSETSQYGKTLPLEIRTKLGLFRLRLQPPDIGEAMVRMPSQGGAFLC
jgi:general transcription factor 3C polypeptide 3 (transcription factor C subunit 4)